MPSDAIGVCDVGGSGGRVSTLTRKDGGYVLETVHEFSHTAHEFMLGDRQGRFARRFYWNLFAIHEGMCEGLRRIGADPERNLLSFGVDGWGSDGVWLSAGGDILFPSVIANDSLWEEARDEVNRMLPGRERFRLTGTYPDNFLVVNQVHWMNTRLRGIVEAAESFMPLPSLYHYWLCGERAVEYTWGATGHLASTLTRAYCDEIFRRLNLPREKMPPLRPTGGQLGVSPERLAGRFGLKPFKVMVPPNHDTACAFAAAPAVPGRTSLTVSAGTWWCMGASLPAPLVNDRVYASGFSNVGGVEGGAVLNVINMGSYASQALRRQWELADGEAMGWEKFNALAGEGYRPDLDFDIDDKRLLLAGDMEKTVAEVAGLAPGSAPATRGRIAALLYVGLARKTARLAGVLGGLLGKPVDEILVIGGGAKNDLMNQWLADIAGLPVRTASPNATTLGNALVQACSLGWFSSLGEGRDALKHLWREKVFAPRGS